MDTFTHAVSGAVIGAATSRGDFAEMRRRALWGAAFAAFPDCDFLMVLFTDHFTYLNEHRGFTHSIILLPAWAALLGLVASRISAASWRARWREMAVLAAAAISAHILGDLITSYGTKIFKPVFDAPLALPITFIIDPYVTLILLAGLVTMFWRRAPKYGATAAIVLCAYLGLQVFALQWATRIGNEYGASLGVPGAPVVVFPQPLSPFNWKVVIAEGENYHRAYVNLLADEPRHAERDAGLLERLWAAYQPATALAWKVYPRWPQNAAYRAVATDAWRHDDLEGFREFALLPYVTSMRGDERRVCAWFTDLRFTLPAGRTPFEYAMCRRDGEWTLEMDAKK